MQRTSIACSRSLRGSRIAFFVLVGGLMILFVVKYRAREGHVEQPSPSHNNALEIIWSVIPVLLVALIFFLGFTAYMDMRTPPADAYDIQVIASKWKFLFRYPNGAESEELHVPPDRAGAAGAAVAGRAAQSSTSPRFVPRWTAFPAATPTNGSRLTSRVSTICSVPSTAGLDHSNMNSIVKVHESQASFEEAARGSQQATRVSARLGTSGLGAQGL